MSGIAPIVRIASIISVTTNSISVKPRGIVDSGRRPVVNKAGRQRDASAFTDHRPLFTDHFFLILLHSHATLHQLQFHSASIGGNDVRVCLIEADCALARCHRFDV